MKRRALILAGLLLAAVPAHAKVHRVVNVVDGDTIDIAGSGPVAVWRIRALGYDTPEKNSGCLAERNRGEQARQFLVALLAPGVRLRSELEQDSPYGRFLAELWTVNGERVADVLKREGLARDYDGRTARRPWCDAEGRLIP